MSFDQDPNESITMSRADMQQLVDERDALLQENERLKKLRSTGHIISLKSWQEKIGSILDEQVRASMTEFLTKVDIAVLDYEQREQEMLKKIAPEMVMAERATSPDVEDMAALVKRLVMALRKTDPENKVAAGATDYLQRFGYF